MPEEISESQAPPTEDVGIDGTLWDTALVMSGEGSPEEWITCDPEDAMEIEL